MTSRGMHQIQIHILRVLQTGSATYRYTDLRPEDTENDLFNYHLQQLIKRGFVEKLADGYALSTAGKAHIVDLHPLDETGQPHRIKLAAMCLVIDDTGAAPRLLYQRRNRQPLASEWQQVGGGLKRGEAPIVAAKRRLYEESGLVADFELAGFIRFWRFTSAGDLYSDILFHVCVARNPYGELTESNEFGRHAWLSVEDALIIEQNRAIGGEVLAGKIRALVSGGAPELFYAEVRSGVETPLLPKEPSLDPAIPPGYSTPKEG